MGRRSPDDNQDSNQTDEIAIKMNDLRMASTLKEATDKPSTPKRGPSRRAAVRFAFNAWGDKFQPYDGTATATAVSAGSAPMRANAMST